MKTNKILLPALAMMFSLGVSAQTTFDAAKLYEEELNGTARYVGMGGAMSALGSDPSVISHNPAGIGTYRKSDINTSVSIFGTSVNTNPTYTISNQGAVDNIRFYSNNLNSDINMSLDNASFIFSGYEDGDNYVNFGVSYRKLQNMDRDMDYYDVFPDEEGYFVTREYRNHQRNKVSSWDFNLSCNLSDMVYLGWTLGVLSTDAWSEGHFYDFYAPGNHPDYPDGLDYTTVDMMTSAEGSGWNMAFGIILRPVSPLRLGLALKTPTLYKQTLAYSDYQYAFRGTQYRELNGELVTYSMEDVSNGVDLLGNYINEKRSVDYKFSSPWSLNLSAGLTFGKTAIGAEFEKHFTQRSSISIGETKIGSQGAVNLKDYSTFKIGIEQNIDNISLRAGYNYIGSMFKDNAYPFMADTDFNGWKYDKEGNVSNFGRADLQIDRLGKTQFFTAGIGYCSAPDYDGTQFYFDLAYVHGIRNSVFNTNEDGANNAFVDYLYRSNKVMFTVGWNF